MTRRRPRRRAGVLLVVALAWGAVCFAAQPPRRRRPGPHRPGAGDRRLGVGRHLAVPVRRARPAGEAHLAARPEGLPQADHRQLPVPRGHAAERARHAAWRRPARSTGVLVVAAGYNDTTANVGLAVDRLVAEAQRQGDRTRRDLAHLRAAGHERRPLRRAQRHAAAPSCAQYPSILRVADWNAKSAGHADWFSSGDPTSVHLSRAGAEALTAYLGVALDAYAGRDRCASANWRGAAVPTAAPPAPASGRLHVLATPVRVYDTRSLDGTLGAARVLTLPLRAVGAVPADAVAAVVTVTLVAPCAGGYAAVGPCAVLAAQDDLDERVRRADRRQLGHGRALRRFDVRLRGPGERRHRRSAGLVRRRGHRLAAGGAGAPVRYACRQVPGPPHTPASTRRWRHPDRSARHGRAWRTGGHRQPHRRRTLGSGFRQGLPRAVRIGDASEHVERQLRQGGDHRRRACWSAWAAARSASARVPRAITSSTSSRCTTAAGHAVTAVTPVRVGDTRNTGTKAPVAAGATLAVGLDGKVSVPSGATAAIVNLTAISSAAGGWVTATTCGQTVPKVSSLNTVAGSRDLERRHRAGLVRPPPVPLQQGVDPPRRRPRRLARVAIQHTLAVARSRSSSRGSSAGERHRAVGQPHAQPVGDE